MYQLAADLILIIHFCFIAFVVFGALLFFISKKIVYIHIPTLAWGVYAELKQVVCPLTYIENWFLKKAGLETYTHGFIQNYLFPIVYPADLTKEMQTYFGIALIAINIFFYGLIIYRQKNKFSLKN